jgi:integrase
MPAKLMLSTVMDEYVHYIKPQYSIPTVAAYTQALHVFGQHLRNLYRVSPSSIELSDLDAGWGGTFMEWLQEARSVETEHLYMRALLQFYQYASEFGADTDAFETLGRFIEINRRPKTHIIPTLPFEAIHRVIELAEASSGLLGAASEREMLGQLRDRAFLLTLAYSGLRISEICDLRKSQLNLEASHISLGDSSQLPLPATAVGALKAYLNKRLVLDQQQPTQLRDHLPLFARHDKRVGSRILVISRWTGANIVEAWVRSALTLEERIQLQEAQQVITPHTFRHHFVLNALMSTDRDVATAQSLARHEDRSTTRRYLTKLTRDSNSNP